MRCSCCAQCVPRRLWPIKCERAGRPRLCARPPSSATTIPTRASARARCARACARAETALLRWQHATCDTRRTACNMQHATCNGQHPYIHRASHVWQTTRDLCRAASCSATGAAQLNCAVVRQATCAVGITSPPPPLPPPHTHTETKVFFNNAAVSAAHWPKSDLSGKRPTHASVR